MFSSLECTMAPHASRCSSPLDGDCGVQCKMQNRFSGRAACWLQFVGRSSAGFVRLTRSSIAPASGHISVAWAWINRNTLLPARFPSDWPPKGAENSTPWRVVVNWACVFWGSLTLFNSVQHHLRFCNSGYRLHVQQR